MERAQSSPQAGTEQSEISSDESAGTARPFQSTYRLERSPANGGAEALTAPWAVRAQTCK